MACGCHTPDPRLKLTAAAMCGLCVGESPACRRGGTVEVRVTHQTCPRRWHPDAQGVVRWLGLDWYGVPYPVRLWLWTIGGAGGDVRAYARRFPGCGCAKALKDYTLSLSAMKSRMSAS